MPLLSGARAAEVFRVLSACWEEPLAQSVKRVQVCFEELLTIQAAQLAFFAEAQQPEVRIPEAPCPFLLPHVGGWVSGFTGRGCRS